MISDDTAPAPDRSKPISWIWVLIAAGAGVFLFARN